MNAAIPAFQSDRSAQVAHASLRQSLKIADQAQHCAVLWFGEILRRKLFRELGYSTMKQYAEHSLGFSRSKTGDFLRLASKLEELPVLKESVASGEVGYTKARQLIQVATKKTEQGWVDEAKNSTRRELTDKVARVKKKAQARRKNPGQRELLPTARVELERAKEVPTRVSLEMSAEQFARYEALWEKLHKLGGVPAGATKADVLLEALAGRVEELERGTSGAATASKKTSNAKTTPRGAAPAAVIHIHECPACARASVQTGAGEKHLPAADLDRAREDATVIEPGKRARQTILPKTRREVLQRDRHRCQTPGCRNTRFLELHHKRPVNKGGTNDPANLVTLCAACHRLVHESGLDVARCRRKRADTESMARM
jgi:5-methylcytosine-specific restriction endonuclease McrA